MPAQTAIFLRIELQSKTVEGSNIYHCIVYQTSITFKQILKKSYLFFKTRFIKISF